MNLKFLEKKWFLILCFVLATLFFLFQHFKGISWDFMVYSMNAQYFFGNQFFFEWLRPPLAPLLIGIFGFLGDKAAEFFYIILISFLHLLSSKLFSKKFGIHENYFYILSLSFFVLINGLNVGSELLVLSMIQFFLAFFGTGWSPLFLGLAFLTRYNSFIFLPLLLFNWNLKKIIRDVLIFLLTISPWFIYNYIKTGNFLYGFVNSYALNVAFREYYIMGFDFMHVLLVINFLIPFFIIGLIFALRKFNKKHFMILLLLIFSLASYSTIPFKTPRYLFFLVLPAVYFSCMFFKRFKPRKILLLILIVVNIFALFSVNYLFEIDDVHQYEEPINYAENCLVMSNAWVHLNYLGREAEPAPTKDMIGRELGEGKVLILYKHVVEPEYVSEKEFLYNFDVIKETDKYIVLGEISGCREKERYVDHYLLRYRERMKLIYDRDVEVSNCAILFKGRMKDFCKLTKVI